MQVDKKDNRGMKLEGSMHPRDKKSDGKLLDMMKKKLHGMRVE